MWADNYWASKALYKEISKAIPSLKGLKLGENLLIKDNNGNLIYRVRTEPLGTPKENLQKAADKIVMGKPDSRIIMLTREVVKLGLGVVSDILVHSIKKVTEIDLREVVKNDFDLHLEDVVNNHTHHIRANKVEGKAQHFLSYKVEFDKEGNEISNKEPIAFSSDEAVRRVLKTESFKDAFDLLRQNIKE